MTFKKVTAALLAATMVLGMTACGSTSSDSSSSSSDAAASTEATSDAAAEVTVGNGESSIKGSNLRILIGSTSTSGDSYMMADLVGRYLSDYMGVNAKVDAVGNATALDELKNAKGDGLTILISHDITYLSVLFGAVDESYALENLTVGPRVGQNPGGCFGASKYEGWNSLADVTEYLKTNTDQTVAFNVESGATSHLAFIAYYLWVKETEGDEVAGRIKAIVGGTTAEKLQRLWDNAGTKATHLVIYGDTSSFEQYTVDGVEDQVAMTMFGSCGEVNGVEIDSMADDGVTYNGEPFDFAKDFCMYLPADVDATVLAEYEAAIQAIEADANFQADMAALYYNTLDPEDCSVEASKEYIYNKRTMCEDLVAQAPSLDELTQ